MMFNAWYVILHTQVGSSVTYHASLNRSEERLGFLKEIHLFTDGGVFIENYVLHSENLFIKCLTIFSI